MSIPETVIGIIGALFLAGFGMFASGIIYDALWSAGDVYHNIADCNTLQDGWDNLCKDEKVKYEGGKILTQSVISIGSLAIVLLFIIRRL